MGKSRGGQGRRGAQPAGGGGLTRGRILIGLIVAAFLAGFVALIVIDRSQQQASEPPEGVEEFEVANPDHVEGSISYEQDPPVGGEHNPVWQNARFYEEPVRNENAVHTLEHGAVWITYSPDLPQDQRDRLREIIEGESCVLASPYPGLSEDSPVVASAWGVQARFESVDDPDLERFINAYQQGPQTPEPGARCNGGTSDTAS